jgi:transcriptional regulator with XRE-family HTH domain
MGDNWAAVAAAIRARVAELDMTQKDLAVRSGVSESTVRQLMNNYGPRRRARHTLEDVSTGLQWPAAHLARVLDDEKPIPTQDEGSSLRAEVTELRNQISELADRMATLERSWRTHQ